MTGITVHKSLQFTLTSNLKSSRLSRWIMLIQEFHFAVQHLPCAQNIVADTLSLFLLPVILEIRQVRGDSVTVSVIKLANYFEMVK